MNTQILIAAVVTSSISPIAFGQMSGSYSQPQAQQPAQSSTGGQQKITTTTTKTTMPVGVKAYLDSQMASSSDKKFHLTVQGKDLALMPTRIHEAKKLDARKSATIVDMKGADGKMYEVEFETSNGQVTGASVLVRKSKT